MVNIRNLSKEDLETVLTKMIEFLNEEQYMKLEKLVNNAVLKNANAPRVPLKIRMSQEYVNEKMEQFKIWMEQIDEGELYLDVEEHEDYSSEYWGGDDWVVEYYDNQGIGDKLMTMIRFAKDCMDDRKYEEANLIFEWLWQMEVTTNSEYDDGWGDFEMLAEQDIVKVDLKQLALQTLYVDYQVLPPEKRAEDIYLYFEMGSFRKLHIEEIFQMGMEELTEKEQFWKDWIALLQEKKGDTASILLQEALLFYEGIDGLAKMADKEGKQHPSLYLRVMKEYEKNHNYVQIEKIGQKAMEKLHVRLLIRSDIAIKAGYASSCLGHKNEMMKFCWESFCSASSVKNYLRLFGTKEMAKTYGLRGKEALANRLRVRPENSRWDSEFWQNYIESSEYLSLCFYTGDFRTVREASKNPKGSLGWSGNFIDKGIPLFLLYLYEGLLPSRAAASIASCIGFSNSVDSDNLMDFEREIREECKEKKITLFWNYFQRWKGISLMGRENCV